MREASDDYVYSHKPPNGSRQLEADLWKSYVGDNYSFDKMIAYHWKETIHTVVSVLLLNSDIYAAVP